MDVKTYANSVKVSLRIVSSIETSPLVQGWEGIN
jgi:hypothetical protein